MSVERLESIYSEFQANLAGVATEADALNLKARYLGKKGALSEIMSGLRSASPDERRVLGAKSNEYKEKMESLLGERLGAIELAVINEKLAQQTIDLTLRNSVLDRGLSAAGYHPVTIIQREIEDIFLSMGFEVLDGPHIEDDYHNFEALNIPGDHPARDMQDTLWFKDSVHLLRTHTSCIQVRGMETHKPPFKFIAPGKCFRAERTDATHEMTFHQLEGMLIDKDISVAHLIYFLKTLVSEIFKQDLEIRLRPGFFPFVEPGFELDINTPRGWMELLPCGMVHPNVLRYGKINPDEFSGFAFGLGLDRMVLAKYQIDDIRLLHSGDLRFVSQFKSFS